MQVYDLLKVLAYDEEEKQLAYYLTTSSGDIIELEPIKGTRYNNLPTNNIYYVDSDYTISDTDTIETKHIVSVSELLGATVVKCNIDLMHFIEITITL